MAFGLVYVAALVAYTAVLVAALYFCVFADPDKSPTALLLTETLPQRSWQLLQRCVSEKQLRIIEFFTDRVLMIVYCVIVFGSWSVIFNYTYPWLNRTESVSNGHKYIGYAVFVSCVLSWRYASTSSPGIVTKKSVERFNHFPHDYLLFLPNRYCSTTGVLIVPRSKYDRYKYKRQTARFDHFCGWIYNTVGEENYRWFLLFLFVHTFMCLYGSMVLWRLFMADIESRGLFDATFVDRTTGEELHGDRFVIMQFMFQLHMADAAVMVLLMVMAVALGSFLLYHIWLASKNMTTNESYKWTQVRQWYKSELRRYEEAVANGEVSPTKEKLKGPTIKEQDVTCTPVSRTPKESTCVENSAPETGTEEVIRHPGPEPRNIYDRGFVENWKEVILPISLRKDRRYSTVKRKDP